MSQDKNYFRGSEVNEKHAIINFVLSNLSVIGSVQKTFYERNHEYESKRQGLVNRKKALEAKRKVAEEKLFAGTLDDPSFTRIRNEIKEEIDSLQNQIFDLEDKREAKIDIAQEILRFTRSAYHGYVKAAPSVKRHYLSLFWEKFDVSNGVIITSCPTLFFRELLKLEKVFLRKAKTQKIPNDVGLNEKLIIRHTQLGHMSPLVAILPEI